MAHHLSAKRRIRSNERKRLRNKASISRLKTLTKKVLQEKDKDKVVVLLREAVSYIDKIVSKKRLHKNTGARKKSKLAKYVNSISQEK